MNREQEILRTRKKSGAWDPMMNTFLINTTKPLMIPINCKLGNSNTYNYWIMVVRFQNRDDTDTGWDFVIADSYNSEITMKRARNIIAEKNRTTPPIGTDGLSRSHGT